MVHAIGQVIFNHVDNDASSFIRLWYTAVAKADDMAKMPLVCPMFQPLFDIWTDVLVLEASMTCRTAVTG